MASIRRLCVVPGCGEKCRSGSRCPEHQALLEDQQKERRRQRNLKTGRRGPGSARWVMLSRRVIARDGRCVYCGSTEDLTADLLPYMNGDHTQATERDCVTACRSCNSSRGARTRGEGVHS